MFRWLRMPLIAVCVVLLIYGVVRSHYLVMEETPVPSEIVALLRKGAVQAIGSGDVPVSAVLLYGDLPIGVGFNTVLRDGNAGGHAEINAVSDAMQKLGNEGFHQLDRDSLRMISTFEPCAMCRGMLIEYRIISVVYDQPKTLRHWIRDDMRWLLYEWNKRVGGPAGLQDSLFRAHPAYMEH